MAQTVSLPALMLLRCNKMLIPDWKSVLNKAWSVKFMVAAAMLSGAESVAAIAGESLAKQFPAGLYAAIVGVITALGVVARLMAQNEATDDTKE
jgi:hypothetical protein